jgi:hypothetical protein
MSDGLVTIGAYSTVFDADMVKGELEAFGVDAVLEDRNLVAANWLWSNMLGGVKVRVPEAQAAEARRILETAGDQPADDEPRDDV